MKNLIECPNLKFNLQPLIWMENNSTDNAGQVTQKAVLVEAWKNRSTGYSIENIPANLSKLLSDLNNMLNIFAAEKKIKLQGPLISIYTNEQLQKQKFDCIIPNFPKHTLIIENLELVKTILPSFKPSINASGKKIDPNVKTQIIKAKKTPTALNVSTYASTISNLQPKPFMSPSFVEFNGLKDIKWQRIEDNKVRYESENTTEIQLLADEIHYRIFHDSKNKNLESKWKDMIEEWTGYALVCPESLLQQIYGYKVPQQNMIPLQNFQTLQQQQALILKSFEKTNQPLKLTPDLIPIIQQQIASNNDSLLPTLFRFDAMNNSIFWFIANANYFTVGSENEINTICSEIIDKIKKSFIPEQTRHINALCDNSEKQDNGRVQLKVNGQLLETLFGQPKLWSIETESPKKVIENTSIQMTAEQFRKTILEKIFEELKIFAKPQQLEILSKICNAKENSLDSLYNYIQTQLEGYNPNIEQTVTNLRNLTEGVCNPPIELDTSIIIIETYSFLGSIIAQLQNELKAEESLKQMHLKLRQSEASRLLPNSLFSSQPQAFMEQEPTPSQEVNNKRKRGNETETKNAHRKLESFPYSLALSDDSLSDDSLQFYPATFKLTDLVEDNPEDFVSNVFT